MMHDDALARLRDAAHRWDVDVERVQRTATSLVGFGVRDDARVVLKVSRSRAAEWDAGAVAAAFGGKGVVRVLEHRPGAALLEELWPGTRLVELVRDGRDEEAIGVLAGVIHAMKDATPPTSGFSTARTWGESFNAYIAGGDEQIPAELVRDARERYVELCRSQSRVRLLHGDLQHYNVLFDRVRGWTAIDPKGVVAETEYELGAALRNPGESPDAYFTPAAVERRVEAFVRALGVDAARTAAWAYAQAVLSAIWLIEDEGTVGPDAPALRLARSVRPLVR